MMSKGGNPTEILIKPEEKGIPMLKFGKANNFYKFRDALSNEATEKLCNLENSSI
jgi:hypothetical protein